MHIYSISMPQNRGVFNSETGVRIGVHAAASSILLRPAPSCSKSNVTYCEISYYVYLQGVMKMVGI